MLAPQVAEEQRIALNLFDVPVQGGLVGKQHVGFPAGQRCQVFGEVGPEDAGLSFSHGKVIKYV